MAYKDSSGRITIDEYAAQQDIRRIRQALDALNNSKVAVNAIIQQAANEKGQTSAAVIEKAGELKKQLDDMINRLNETASFISRVVKHYQEVDRQVKEAIKAAQLIGSSGGGGNGAFGSGKNGGGFR